MVHTGLPVFVAAVALNVLACSSAPTPGAHVDVNGIRMYYEIHGAGPPLMLLHGGLGSGMQFEKQIPEFEKRYKVIVPDCRAQGRTTDGPGPLTYHVMAEDMIALLDQLQLKRVDVMGWSDGGVIGLDMAIHHPGRISHLVTFGANFLPDGLNPQDVAWGEVATPESLGAGMRESWMKLNPQPDHYDAAMTRILAMWRTQPRFTLDELGSIRAQTLICAGEHDVVRREHTEQLARAIPGAQMWIVPGASHSAMMEQPALVNARVLEFLEK